MQIEKKRTLIINLIQTVHLYEYEFPLNSIKLPFNWRDYNFFAYASSTNRFSLTHKRQRNSYRRSFSSLYHTIE